MSFRVTQTNIWSQRWWADLSPTAAHIYHWVYTNQRTDGACSSGLYHALLTDIMSGSHVTDREQFEKAFKELTDAGIVNYDYENALLLDTRCVIDQLVNVNQLKGALAYLGSLDPLPIVMEATKLIRIAFERVMEPYRNPSDGTLEKPLRNPLKGHRKGKDSTGEDRRGKERKDSMVENPDFDAQINALMTGFDKDEKTLVGEFLSLAASERKTGRIAATVRMRLVNELHQLKRDYPAEFKTGLTETVDRGIPNSNYAKAVIRGMGKKRQQTLRLWSAEKRRAEYEANRAAKEKSDRAAEKVREETKRRMRAKEERVTHEPGGEGKVVSLMPGPEQGRCAPGNRRLRKTDAGKGGAEMGDGGQRDQVVEVSGADLLGAETTGAIHAGGERPGDGDE
ncbi:MAG: hypothetical protein WCP22_03225 [Chlamydiota bacterium]